MEPLILVPYNSDSHSALRIRRIIDDSAPALPSIAPKASRRLGAKVSSRLGAKVTGRVGAKVIGRLGAKVTGRLRSKVTRRLRASPKHIPNYAHTSIQSYPHTPQSSRAQSTPNCSVSQVIFHMCRMALIFPYIVCFMKKLSYAFDVSGMAFCERA